MLDLPLEFTLGNMVLAVSLLGLKKWVLPIQGGFMGIPGYFALMALELPLKICLLGDG